MGEGVLEMNNRHRYGVHGQQAERELIIRLLIGLSSVTVGFIMGLFIMFASMKVHASDQNNEVYCLAQNIYFESGNQSMVGKIAVSHVVLNRVESTLYPDTICDVVYQAKWRENWKGNMVPVLNQCQFSWFCDGKSDYPEDSKTWIESLLLARRVYDGEWTDITEGATHYHADFVYPYWADSLNRTTTIDNHLFYR